MSEKPTAIILPSWNPDEPRFIVKNCEHNIAEDREFRNNTCVYNQRLKIAYSVEEIVEVLNNMGDKIDDLDKENEKLRRLFEEMKQPITINLTEEDEKELRKLLGLIDDE